MGYQKIERSLHRRSPLSRYGDAVRPKHCRGKGTKLYVEGRLQTRSYDDKEGVKRYVTEVVAENLVLLGGTASSNSNGNGGSGRERSARRPAPGKPSNGHRDRTPEPAEQGLEDDGVPF